jgi:hypothetical protein
MNVDLGPLPLGAMALLAALLLVAWSARGRDPADVFVGLFKSPCDLGWPRGVQEEDRLRRWDAPTREPDTDDGRAAIEDLAMPTWPFTASWPVERIGAHSVRSAPTPGGGTRTGPGATTDDDRGR